MCQTKKKFILNLSLSNTYNTTKYHTNFKESMCMIKEFDKYS